MVGALAVVGLQSITVFLVGEMATGNTRDVIDFH